MLVTLISLVWIAILLAKIVQSLVLKTFIVHNAMLAMKSGISDHLEMIPPNALVIVSAEEILGAFVNILRNVITIQHIVKMVTQCKLTMNVNVLVMRDFQVIFAPPLMIQQQNLHQD